MKLLDMVIHVFNSSTQEAVRPVNSGPACSTWLVPGQPELHRETLSQNTEQQNLQTMKLE